MTFTEVQKLIVANGTMPTIQQITTDKFSGKIDEDEAIARINDVVNFYNVVCRRSEGNT